MANLALLEIMQDSSAANTATNMQASRSPMRNRLSLTSPQAVKDFEAKKTAKTIRMECWHMHMHKHTMPNTPFAPCLLLSVLIAAKNKSKLDVW